MNNTQMLKGILDWCVLSVIKRQKTYSREIVDKLKARGFEGTSDGTLFPLLLRLEREGLVSSEKKDNPLGADRKYYLLTPKGDKELNEFLSEWSEFKHIVDGILNDGGTAAEGQNEEK